MSPITVFIAHVAARWRRKLVRLLVEEDGFVSLGESSRSSDTLAKVKSHRPNVLLLDTRLAPHGPEEFLGRLRAASPTTKIISIPPKYSRGDEMRFARSGARGYLPKGMVPSSLPKAIRVVHDGEIWMRKETVSRIFEEYVLAASLKRGASGPGVTSLTQKEFTILQWVVRDKSRREIARALRITEKTVERSLNQIVKKLG